MVFHIVKRLSEALLTELEKNLITALERAPFVSSSLVEGLEANGIAGLFSLQAIHGYIYGRWSTPYIHALLALVPFTGPRVKQHLADHYHGKVLTPAHAEAIVDLDTPIPLTDLEQIVPYPTARDLLLNSPPEIVAFECPCRNARAKHCEPTQVCMLIGEPFAHFALEHHPEKTRPLTREEALALLAAEHERGHVHTAWFKNACLGRFYAICNCCSCCCGGIEAMTKHDIPMMTASGYRAAVDDDACVGCGVCIERCPFDAIASIEDGIRVENTACMGCGVCVDSCAKGALTMVRDAAKGDPLDVNALAGK